ncbi:hypothetical protein EX30DRAFT_397925 [Ascodesmis nigricans]|uniref:Uncharacterized protein n=1 Tax=Ascodesmis nigricans TaxID=341454 RepID=A0A4S2MRA4_9PEZI|nr:hypothetical protein EX30DRAFT_397925 [Ascodesmis nigricans]
MADHTHPIPTSPRPYSSSSSDRSIPSRSSSSTSSSVDVSACPRPHSDSHLSSAQRDHNHSDNIVERVDGSDGMEMIVTETGDAWAGPLVVTIRPDNDVHATGNGAGAVGGRIKELIGLMGKMRMEEGATGVLPKSGRKRRDKVQRVVNEHRDPVTSRVKDGIGHGENGKREMEIVRLMFLPPMVGKTVVSLNVVETWEKILAFIAINGIGIDPATQEMNITDSTGTKLCSESWPPTTSETNLFIDLISKTSTIAPPLSSESSTPSNVFCRYIIVSPFSLSLHSTIRESTPTPAAPSYFTKITLRTGYEGPDLIFRHHIDWVFLTSDDWIFLTTPPKRATSLIFSRRIIRHWYTMKPSSTFSGRRHGD